MRLLFISPAYERLELSRICFEQRQWAIEKLARAGIEAQSIVVADDDNIEIARSLGHDYFRRDNEWLGRRFNDGYEHAHDEGFTHAFPIGSDSWVDPEFIIQAYIDGHFHEDANDGLNVVCSRHYSRIDASGTVRRQLWIPVLQGVSYIVPVKALDECGYRPCQEEIRRGCDGSTWQSVSRRRGVQVVWSEVHELETTAFESTWPQVTHFSRLAGRFKVHDITGDIFSGLKKVYPPNLVDDVASLYERARQGVLAQASVSKDVDQRVREITASVLTGRIPTALRQQARPLIEQAVRLALQQP